MLGETVGRDGSQSLLEGEGAFERAVSLGKSTYVSMPATILKE